MSCTALAALPITATRFAGEVVVVVPARGVEDRPREPVEAGDVGRDRRAEHAERADHDVGLDDLSPSPTVRRQTASVVVPARGVDLGAEPEVRRRARSARRTSSR